MFKSYKEIYLMFLDFFFSKNHKLVKSSSLIPYRDNSLLFTNSGMNQFKEYFLGITNSNKSSIVTIQRCLRIGGKHNDLSYVGYTNRHNTFFYMMGNFSFGSYFKKKAILYAWELLTNKKFFNIPKERLFVTVHISDIETYNIWSKIIQISDKNIIVLGKEINIKCIDSYSLDSDNFWRMSNFGPCGPCTEIFYNLSNNSNIDRTLISKVENNIYLEIWNLVFMEYNYISEGCLENLNNKFIDTGMGLERIASVLQGVNCNFEIDFFMEVINIIVNITTINLTKKNKSLFYVISDHIRSIIYLLCDGLLPSNDYRGYVLRKLIRRTILHIRFLGIKDYFLFKLVKPILNLFISYGVILFDYIFLDKSKIINLIYLEEVSFQKVIDNGLLILNEYKSKLDKDLFLSGKKIFFLYDTLGIPLDIIKDFCNYNNITLDIDNFNLRLKRCKEKSKNFFKKKKIFLDLSKIRSLKTNFLGFSCLNKINTVVVGIFLKSGLSVKILEFEGILIFKESVFFPKSGGQVGDIGFVLKYDNSAKFNVQDTQIYGEFIIHIGYMEYGFLNIFDDVLIQYDMLYRKMISCNHSSTHLLYSSIKNILDFNIIQKGSNITKNLISFDFSYDLPLTKNDLSKIEDMVNLQIRCCLPMIEKISQKKSGWSEDLKKYEKFIFLNGLRLIKFGNFSSEYCCGTHVMNTGEIGLFLIIKCYSISLGIKRIEAISSLVALNYVKSQKDYLKGISSFLCVKDQDILDVIVSLKKKKKELSLKFKELNNLCLGILINFVSLKNIFLYKKNSFLVQNIYLTLSNEVIYMFLNYLKKKFNLTLIVINLCNENCILLLLNNKNFFSINFNKIIKVFCSFFNFNICEDKVIYISKYFVRILFKNYDTLSFSFSKIKKVIKFIIYSYNSKFII